MPDAAPKTAAPALIARQVTMMGCRIRLAGEGRRLPIKVPPIVEASRQGKDMYIAQPGLNQANTTDNAATAPAEFKADLNRQTKGAGCLSEFLLREASKQGKDTCMPQLGLN